MNNLFIANAHIVTPLGNKALKGHAMRQLHDIPSGCIKIKDGLIVDIGTNLVNEEDYPLLDAKNHLVLPGFVDSHTHLIFGGYRPDEFMWRMRGDSYMSIMQRGGGIINTVTATRSASFQELLDKARYSLEVMSQMGVTTVEGKSGCGLDKDTEIKQLQVIKAINEDPDRVIDLVPTFLGAHALPSEYKNNPDAYIDFLIKEMLPLIKENKLAEICDVFCEKGVFDIDQSRRLLEEAKEQGYLIKLHADEIVSFGGAELASDLKALSADHLLHVSDQGIKSLSESGVIATLLPLTAFVLKEPYARGRDMIDSGCAVALASDFNPGSCFSSSIPLIIALSCLYMNLSIEETITALTLNGAAALNKGDVIGSIEIGKKADIIIFSVNSINMLPYYTGMNAVKTVIKAGRILRHRSCEK